MYFYCKLTCPLKQTCHNLLKMQICPSCSSPGFFMVSDLVCLFQGQQDSQAIKAEVGQQQQAFYLSFDIFSFAIILMQLSGQQDGNCSATQVCCCP